LTVEEREELELVVVCDEAEVVGFEIAADLGGLGKGGEAVAGWLDFNGAAFGELAGEGLGLGGAGDGKQAAVGEACAVSAGMGLEVDAGLEGFANGVEEIGEGSVEGGFGGVAAQGVGCAQIGEVLVDGAGRGERHQMMIA
jgi:hypothetical protein